MTKCPWIAGLCAFEGARILPANRKGIREAIGVTSGGGYWLLQQSDSVCSMHTGFPVFGPLRTCGECLEIRMLASSSLFDGQKNDLRLVWTRAFRMVRPQASPGSRSSGGWVAHIPGVRGAACRLPAV